MDNTNQPNSDTMIAARNSPESTHPATNTTKCWCYLVLFIIYFKRCILDENIPDRVHKLFLILTFFCNIKVNNLIQKTSKSNVQYLLYRDFYLDDIFA